MTFSTEQSRYTKKFIEVHGKRMAYIDEGSGDPIVFLHGNKTSCFFGETLCPTWKGRDD